MAGDIASARARVVRIHASGDFHTAEYARAWVEVAGRCPGVRFYAYTRGWRVPAIRRELKKLAARPNVELWYSEDRETGRSPRDPRVRVAYMLEGPEGEGEIPPDADLVFRVIEDRPAKRLGGVQVCPYETGIEGRAGKTTCERCGLCWARGNPDKQAIRFRKVIENG